PKNTPEELIWNDTFSDTVAKAVLDINKYTEYIEKISTAQSFKEKFSIHARYISGDDKSDEILMIQKTFIQKWINDGNEDYRALSALITKIRQYSDPPTDASSNVHERFQI
ncbi:hypothetical protein IQ277_36190, partial [Nostocales cyanobacterium LEGE 12452]|nr:hypothetical protein [Nostocales cyanobacterium LEGE 12452]